MPKQRDLLNKLKKALDLERYNHSLRVEKTALALAKHHQVDQEKASLAGLLHDYARQFSRPRMLAEAARHGLKIDRYSRAEPKLLHAPLGAILVKQDFKINDPDILSAIAKHTLGGTNLTKLEKVIYLADHVEEGRDHPEAADHKKLSFLDLDLAVAAVAQSALQYLKSQGKLVHPTTKKTWQYYSRQK